MACKIVKKFVKNAKTESVSGILGQTNTLDGKKLFKKR